MAGKPYCYSHFQKLFNKHILTKFGKLKMKELNTNQIEDVNGGFLPQIVAGLILVDFAIGVYEGFTA
jgi:lactobin A/cerein 7B family class IIb bacteriocin